MISQKAISIFRKSIETYHIINKVEQSFKNLYPIKKKLDHLLHRKNWIDTIQWHLEDLIRDPKIDPIKALQIKRKIDALNQDRTDTVEYIDSFFLKLYKEVVKPQKDTTINTESPAWAIDRLSILELKIYHMEKETIRKNVTPSHKKNCIEKLNILLEQRKDLAKSIDNLLEDIKTGKKIMKVYKQMKMYNDENLNPILYKKE